jgi:hypothetical protein
MSSLHHVYHLYADGKWQEPWSEHLLALDHGLRDHLVTFAVSLVGTVENRDCARRSIKQAGASVVVESDDGWEQVAIHWIQQCLLSNDGALLYCHSKGAAFPSAKQQKWRRTMTHDVVIEWKSAFDCLRQHDAVGSWWHQPSEENGPVGYFAGNFWWANIKFLRTLPDPLMIHRYGAEGWLGMNDAIHSCALRPGEFPKNTQWQDQWVFDIAKAQNT